METKTYCAPSMAEALAEVKRDLGRDAVIMHTRYFRKGGWLGIGGRPMWEITASSQVNVPLRLPSGRYVPVPPSDVLALPSGGLAAADAGTTDTLSEALCQRMGEIHHMVARLLSRTSEPLSGKATLAVPETLPEELTSWRSHLLRQELAEETVNQLMEQLRKDLTAEEMTRAATVRQRLVDLISAPSPRPT